jgi:hypothetical protein
MAKRKLTSSEKFNLERKAMAKEKPRNPNHMVIVTVGDETDDDGNPIITVMRMRVENSGKRPREVGIRRKGKVR